MPFKVYWDNGYEACGTFSEVYATEAEAEAAAESIYRENVATGVWDDQASTEALEVDEPSEDEKEEAAAAEEQSLDYFNRYIAGDR